jgi:WD40 repeat protein
VKRGARARIELTSLLAGLLFGAGTNLVTAAPQTWWEPLRVTSSWAPIWLPAAVLSVVGWELCQRWREKRLVHWSSPQSPYAGLEPYGADRSLVFFGRDLEIEELGERLTASGVAAETRFIALVGPSGSGKSSLIQAGLLPLLPATWTIVGPIQPGADPFLALAACLVAQHDPQAANGSASIRCAQELRTDAAGLRSHPQARPRTLLAHLTTLAQGGRMLAVIDQWEELSSLAVEQDRHAFVSLLAAALDSMPRLHIIGCIRSDVHRVFRAGPHGALFADPYTIGTLGPRAIRDVIIKPAIAGGLTFEDGLVEAMVVESTGRDALPLLAYLLERLHEDMGNDRIVTFDSYERAGQVGGAIARRANQIYDRLASHEDVDRVLLKFVAWSGREAVPRQVSAAELGGPDRGVVDEFRAIRLIVDVNNGDSFHLAHEALLRQWDRFSELIAAEEDRLRRRSALEQRAYAWAGSGADSEDRLRGSALLDAEILLSDFGPDSVVARFIAESRAAHAADRRQRADRAADWARQIRMEDRGLSIAVARAATAELAATESAVLALWSLTAKPSLSRLALAHSSDVTSIVWSPDGATFVSAAEDGSICTWQTDGLLTGFAAIPPDEADPLLMRRHLRINATATRLACWDSDGLASLWRLPSMECLGRFQLDGLRNAAFAWSPNGRLLANVDNAGLRISAFGETPGARPINSRSQDVGWVTALSWSPDGQSLALSGSDSILIVDVSSGGREPDEIPVTTNGSPPVWSPDGTLLAITEENGRIQLIDVASGRTARRWRARADLHLAWSPDGALIASTRVGRMISSSRALRRTASDGIDIWDCRTGARLRSHDTDSLISALEWSPDGTFLAYAHANRRGLALWAPDDDHTVPFPCDDIAEISYSPDRSRAVARLAQGRVSVVGAAAADRRTFKDDPEERTRSVAWSPTGDLAVSADASSIEIWNTTTLAVTRRWDDLPSNRRQYLAWRPDGAHVACAGRGLFDQGSGSVEIWSPDSDVPVAVMAGVEPCGPLTWSLDGRFLAGTCHGTGEVVVWLAETGDIQTTLTARVDGVSAIQWSHNGTLLAVAMGEFAVLLWNPHERRTIAMCVGHTQKVVHVRWAPDDSMIATASDDDTVRLWKASTGQALAVIDDRHMPLRDLAWTEGGDGITATTSTGVVKTWTIVRDSTALIQQAVATSQRTLTDAERARFDLSTPGS